MAHVLVMGVCGVGKSTVARTLAERLGAPFVEGDSFHSTENVAWMSRGRSLNDEMRIGWLDAIGDFVSSSCNNSVIACSALKESYRERLRKKIGDVLIVHLTGKPDLLAQRVSGRSDHFMPASLVSSQFADLEPPKGATVVEIDVAMDPDTVITTALSFVEAAQLNPVT